MRFLEAVCKLVFLVCFCKSSTSAIITRILILKLVLRIYSIMDPERLRIIEIANNLFGESEWSFSVSHVVLDYVDQSHSGNYAAGSSAVIRVQRSNGTFREGLGYGSSSGTNKVDAISQAKKGAVSDGLKGAVINFGGDVARRFNTDTPRISVDTNQGTASHQSTSNVLNTPISPRQVALKPSSVSMNVIISSTNPSTRLKPDPVNTRVAASPVAMPLQQLPTEPHPSEEELVKLERKRRQRQLQEEFRKKHLLEQAQAQSKALEKGATELKKESREPLKEQQERNHRPATADGCRTNVLDDDDVIISTLDMEAALAGHNSNASRHMPMVSSPSIVKPPAFEAMHHSIRSSGQKRPDLSNYAFNGEKKPKGK